MLLRGESMPAAHALEAGANRGGEQTGQSLRRKVWPPCDADTAVRCAECTEPDAAPRFGALRHGVSPGRVRYRGVPPTVAAAAAARE